MQKDLFFLPLLDDVGEGNKVGELLLLTKRRHCVLSIIVRYLITIAIKG